MKINNKKFIFELFLFAALIMMSASFAYSQQSELNRKSEAQKQAKVFHLRPDDVTALVAKYGSLSSDHMTVVANPVRGFYSPQDMVTWTVIAPREEDYVVSVLFSMKDQVNI